MNELGAWLCRGLLALAMLACVLPAQAQRLPQPSARTGDDSAPTELATQVWTRAQLETWWGALRRHAVTGGERLDLPAELLPPADPAAWQPTTLPDVRPRPGAMLLSAGTGCTCQRATVRWRCTCRGW